MSGRVPTRPAATTITRKVEWVDTDASGHWHNTAVVRLCEMAESALLAELDLEELFYSNGAPRVRMEGEFKRSARFGDLVDIRCEIAEVGRSKVVFDHRVTGSEGILATLTVTAVLVDEGGSPRSLPADARSRLLESGSVGSGA